MASWTEITAESPELAAQVEQAFGAHKHKTLATIRKDGSPRISGTEVDLAGGELWLGSMPGAMKALDLRRDPRFAVHSAPLDVELKTPDVKLAGRVVEIVDEAEQAAWAADRADPVPDGPFHLFRLDVDEVVATTVEGDELVVVMWHAGRGTRRVART